MAKRVFVITEATSEFGKALALNLAKTGETLVIIAHDEESGNTIRNELAQATQNSEIDLEICDLSILSSVRNLAEILKSKHEKINVLLNNMSVRRRTRVVTVDGFEEMFSANYLGPFLLTNLLLERLQAAVQADGAAHVLNVTPPTIAPLNFDDLQSEREFDPAKAFEATHMANLLFTFALARRLEKTGITVNAVSPGSEPSQESPAPLRFFRWLLSQPPSQASGNIVESATAAESKQMTGKFLQEGQEIEAPSYARDHEAQERLWKLSEDLTELSSTKGVTPINDPHL